MRRDDQGWMWSEALAMLTRAEQLQRQLFHPRPAMREPSWEPPVDVLELEDEVLILVALPGVDPDQVEVVIDGPTLVFSGRRTLPAALRTAVIHRLELPQGRFERRVPLPAGAYVAVERSAGNGCLLLSLRKAI